MISPLSKKVGGRVSRVPRLIAPMGAGCTYEYQQFLLMDKLY